jgi:hypothetical protein
MSDLIVPIHSLQDRGVELRSRTKGIDTAAINGSRTFLPNTTRCR